MHSANALLACPALRCILLLCLFALGYAEQCRGARAQSLQSAPPSPAAAQPPRASTPPTPSQTAPSAAPRQLVQQTAKPTPVVQPQGTPHAQQRTARATKQPAKPAAQAVTPPPPPPAPAEPPPTTEAKPAAKESDLSFAALRFDDVNMRRGPGPRFPIDWVYKRRDLPVQIEREFKIWRLIRDPDGTRGWVSQASLSHRRTFIVTGADATLRHDADDNAPAVAILKPNVIGRIRSCEAGSDWCRVQSGDYAGYLKRTQFWGTQPGEAVAP